MNCEKFAWMFHSRNHSFIQLRKPLLIEELKKLPIVPPLTEDDGDFEMLDSFLLTYRTFVKPSEVLEYLQKRFLIFFFKFC